MKVRTRIAPSPTGIPHIGTARTALFDYLLAKKHGGDFILRLEDTDRNRYQPETIEVIYEMHDFLGLTPDEGPEQGGKFAPYVQSERKDIYQKYAKELVDKGAAYEDEGAIRIKMPKEGYATWKDLIQGKLSYPYAEVDDKVLLKSDGLPTYHLAAMVDDHLMGITHILRGVEWISSTPVHLLIYEALDWDLPVIGHFPLILGPDKSKLSKRHGAKSALEYRDEGYLPEAINNFLFFIGNSYKDNSDILSLDEMISIFDETRLQKQNAIFDIDKLNYFNKHWIARLEDEDLQDRLQPFIPKTWNKEIVKQIIPLVKPRIGTLLDFKTMAEFYFKAPKPPKELADKKDYLENAKVVLEKSDWTKEAIETDLQDLTDKKDYHRGEFFMSLRLAICGQKVTPPLTESMLVLGRDEVLSRLATAI